VTDWAVVFLGVIAVATLAMAFGQIGVFVAASRAARRIERLADQMERELGSVLGHLNAAGRDAARVCSLAAAQVERADRAITDFAQQADQTFRTIQATLGGSAKQGSAFLAGLRAALDVLREVRAGRGRTRADEEDALFI
jgi:hypothetical protein